MQSVLLWDGSAVKSTRVLSNRLKLTLLPRRIPVDDRQAALVAMTMGGWKNEPPEIVKNTNYLNYLSLHTYLWPIGAIGFIGQIGLIWGSFGNFGNFGIFEIFGNEG